MNFNNGNWNNNNTYNRYFVAGASESVLDIDGWEAAERSFYRNKHGSIGAQRLHIHPGRVLKTARQVEAGEYHPKPGFRFPVFEPSPREIFFAREEDRLVHHYVAPYISAIAERIHILNRDVSHGNRAGHSAQTGAEQIRDALMEATKQYENPFVVLIDIRSCFPSVPRQGAYDEFERYAKMTGAYDARMLAICKTLILHNPVPGCATLASEEEMNRIPKRKRLDGGPNGMPIGNFYTQLIVNLYLALLDAALKPFGINPRFVDDKCLVAPDKETALLEIKIARMVASRLGLSVHPDKLYIQPAHHGVNFCGRTIKGRRIYLSNRTLNRAFRMAREGKRDEKAAVKMRDSANSYLGLMRHCTEWKNECRLADAVLATYRRWLYFSVRDGHLVCVMRRRYGPRVNHENFLRTLIRRYYVFGKNH